MIVGESTLERAITEDYRWRCSDEENYSLDDNGRADLWIIWKDEIVIITHIERVMIMRMQKRLTATLIVTLLLFTPFTATIGGLPGSGEDPHPGIMDENNTTLNDAPSTVIHRRTSITPARGFVSNASGDLTRSEIENGAWIKKIGNGGEIYLNYNDGGTIHKFTISLIDFKGNTKIDKPPKEVKTKKIPSNSTIHGYIDSIPATIRWTEYPFTIKEEVIWNSTILKSVSYELKIQSKNITIDTTTLEFLYDGDRIGVSLDTPIITDSGKLLEIPLEWSLSRTKDNDKDKYWTLDINWTYLPGSSAPYILDPTISFNGTTFKIEDGKLEVKTYQQLWSIYIGKGTNVRYNGGYCAIDSDGVNQNVGLVKLPSPALDLSAMTDFTIDVRTTNGDADWFLKIYITDDESESFTRYKLYTKALTNDVDTTYTLSDFTASEYNTVDMSAIDYILVYFIDIDNGPDGNIICEIKDFKFTTPVKTSDLYDSTGRAVLYKEDFEGDDGLAANEYMSTITYTVAGTSLLEIDDAQAPGSGSTSLFVRRDGTNNPVLTVAIPDSPSDYTRISYYVRALQVNAGCWLLVKEGATILSMSYFRNAVFRIPYGDGIGGDNDVDVPVVANTNYKIDVDMDFTNDKQRAWVDGVMYPGPNANAQGFDNFRTDAVGAKADRWEISSLLGTGDFWFDDIKVYTGFEDFSALTAPHDIDDICEAVSPSGTDYGRGTWDGDWATNGVSIAVDNTKAVIGTNSIKANDLDYIQLISYAYDTAIDISSFTNMRFYCFPETGMTTIRVYLYCTIGGSREISVTVTPNKWSYVDLDINGAWSGWGETGNFEPETHNQLFIMIFTVGTNNLDIWIDGPHFYGDTNAGVCFQGNSIDLNGTDLNQDRAIYDIFQITDTTGSPGTWTAIMANATHNLNVEFSDIVSAGFDPNSGDDIDSIVIRGYDKENIIVLTSVGDATPTSSWDTDQWYGDKDLQNFRISYCGKIEGGVSSALTLKNGTISHSTGSGIRFYDNTRPADTVIENVSFDDLNYNIRLQGLDTTNPIYFENITVTNIKGGGSIVSSFAAVSAMLIFRNSTFDENEMGTLPTNFLMVSKNHNKTDGYLIHITGTGLNELSDIPSNDRWGDGADVDVLTGTLDIDVAATLTNGSWTKDGGVTVTIQNNFKLNMINSTFASLDFTIEATGSLVESNFTTASFVVSGSVASGTVTNTTYSSWVGYYNSWNGSGYQPVTWLYEWGDGINTSSTTEMNQEHDYGTVGSFIVTIHTFLWNDDNGNGEFPIGVFIIANFTFYNTGGFYSFVDTSATNNTTIISWAWDFGDGSTSTEQSPDHQYTIKGEYTVTLTVIDNETNTNMTSMDIGVTWFTPSEQITYVITPFVEAAIILLITLMVIFKLVLMPMQKSLRRMV